MQSHKMEGIGLSGGGKGCTGIGIGPHCSLDLDEIVQAATHSSAHMAGWKSVFCLHEEHWIPGLDNKSEVVFHVLYFKKQKLLHTCELEKTRGR